MANSIASTTYAKNPRYACYWLDSCRGQHELDQCSHWRRELHGKLGIYYSPNGIYKRFSYDNLSHADLTNNPTGCTTVHLLIYTVRPQGEKEILFGLSNRKNDDQEANRRPLLSFPSSKPRKRGEYGMPVAHRAFEWVSDRSDISKQGLKSRFLYQHANVIYPLYVTNEQADILTQNFIANEEILSLHWFPLTAVLKCLPEWPKFLTKEATTNELAQRDHFKPIPIHLDQYELWLAAATCLMCIREYVPGAFETFLNV